MRSYSVKPVLAFIFTLCTCVLCVIQCRCCVCDDQWGGGNFYLTYQELIHVVLFYSFIIGKSQLQCDKSFEFMMVSDVL